MRIPLLLALALLASGCASQMLEVDFDGAIDSLTPLDSLATHIEILEVTDARGVPAEQFGTSRVGGRFVPAQVKDGSVADLVAEALRTLLGSDAPATTAEVTIETLHTEQTIESNGVHASTFVALEFHLGSQSESPRTIPVTARAEVVGTGNAENETSASVLEALSACALQLTERLSGVYVEPSHETAPWIEPGHPRLALMLGLGQDFGGAGASIEWMFGETGRTSITGGIGNTFQKYEPLDDFVSTTAWSLGARRYLNGGKHRVYLQALVGPTSWHGTVSGWKGSLKFDPEETYYGWGVGGGYKYTAYTGFTILAGIYTMRDTHFDQSDSGLTLGFGYSFWSRRSVPQ